MTELVAMTLVRIALCAAVSWLVWRYVGIVLAVLTVPLWGVALARPIVEFAGHFYVWVNRSPLAAWQGRYYNFNGAHLRVIPVAQALWIVDRDIPQVLGEKPTLLLPDQFDATEYGNWRTRASTGFQKPGSSACLNSIRMPSPPACSSGCGAKCFSRSGAGWNCLSAERIC